MEKVLSAIFAVAGFIAGSFGILCHFSNEVAKEKLRGNAPLPAELKLDPLMLDSDWLIGILLIGGLFLIIIAGIIDVGGYKGWKSKLKELV
ncbi:hypothetical protein KAS41_03490 [Candidatus Parcubacteria bacterium]|nr:hypothetical protein [Candidatus Parcubacteria bacterium]